VPSWRVYRGVDACPVGLGGPHMRLLMLESPEGTICHVARRAPCRHPYTEEALEQIKRDNVGRLVILPLYPQFSISTSGSSLRLLEKILKEVRPVGGTAGGGGSPYARKWGLFEP